MSLPRIYPLSETAMSIEWGNTIDEAINAQVHGFDRMLQQKPFSGLTGTVPAYTTLTVFYDAALIAKENGNPFLFVSTWLENLLTETEPDGLSNEHTVMIPVCFDEEMGIDLEWLATAHQLTKEAVIEIFLQQEYRVYMMGFLPGFAYMGSVDDAIATPRKATPRPRVEAGAVGIAGKQTGIYPLPSPGGWQIIGRTPLTMFDPERPEPFLLKAGDKVRYKAIDAKAFMRLKEETQTMKVEQQDIADAVVIRPGVFSTFQDMGRPGFGCYGIPVSGAMDAESYALANALLGNSRSAAAIECTMGGLTLQFNTTTQLAITGAGEAYINNIRVTHDQPIGVQQNDCLEIRFNNNGMRTYLAVKGGFSTPLIMGSRSCCNRSNIGTVLQKGTALYFEQGIPDRIQQPVNAITKTVHQEQNLIRVMAGPEMDWLGTSCIDQFFTAAYLLSNRCDRMGYQLQGEPLLPADQRALLSTAVIPGTIQLTPNGQLIILMHDCQTTGGYPRVAQVAAADLPVLAQLKPGNQVRFTKISFTEAEELYLLQQKRINALFR